MLLSEYDIEMQDLAMEDAECSVDREEDSIALEFVEESGKASTYKIQPETLKRLKTSRARKDLGKISFENLRDLDDYQRKAKSTDLTMINAGPGTGKTTTVCRIICELLMERGESVSILVLSFTVQAEKELLRTVRSIVSRELILSKADVMMGRGLSILTFDKMAYQVTGKNGGTYSDKKREAGESLNSISQNGNIIFDYLIIDECQDVGHHEARMLIPLEKLSRRVILAGDPRQECFRGTMFFSDRWCRSVVVPGKVEKMNLVYNYRSCEHIVNMLNAYSAINFPNIGGNLAQISARGSCKETCETNRCLHIIHCKKNVDMGRSIFRDLSPQTQSTLT